MRRLARAALSRTTVVVVALALVGCGHLVEDIEHVGRVGVSVDEAGTPVVVVEPCREGTAQVTISLARTEDMPSDQQNEEVGVWTADRASDQPSELNLGSPEGWSGDPVGPPATDQAWLVSGTFDGEDGTTMLGPSMSADQVAALTPDRVITDDGTVDRADFDGACGSD